MKKYLLIIGLALAVTSSHSQDEQNQGFKTRTYKDYGFSVDFPSVWVFEKTGQEKGCQFYLEYFANNDSSKYLVDGLIASYIDEFSSIDAMMDVVLEDLEESINYSGFKEAKRMDDQNASLVELTATDISTNKLFRVTLCFFYSESRFITIYFYNLDTDHANLKDTYQKIYKSFKWTN